MMPRFIWLSLKLIHPQLSLSTTVHGLINYQFGLLMKKLVTNDAGSRKWQGEKVA